MLWKLAVDRHYRSGTMLTPGKEAVLGFNRFITIFKHSRKGFYKTFVREIMIEYSRDIVLAGAVTTGIVRGALVMVRVDVVGSSTLGRPDSWQM